MKGYCAILLIFLAWAGMSTAEDMGENLQLTKRIYYQPGCSPCSGIVCSNSGTCDVYENRPECNCATNYVGVTCKIQLAHNCETHSCLFQKSFDSGSYLGKWKFKDLHYPSANLLIANLYTGGKAILTTGHLFWGRKYHKLFFRVRFHNALYKPGTDKVVVSVDDPYSGDKSTLKTVYRSDYPNDSTTEQFCIKLPKTYTNFYAVSFTIHCESAHCAQAIGAVDVTEIALQGLTIQEGAEC